MALASLVLGGILAPLACRNDGADDTGAPKEEIAAHAVAPDDLLAIAGQEVTLDGSTSVGTAFSWDLGDGSSAQGATVVHAWTEAGSYRVTLEVDGAPPDSDSLVVTVVNPPLSPAPVASGRLVGDGARLFAALPDFDQVAVVQDGVVTRVEVCDRPTSLSASAQGLAVACRDEVRWYDPELALLEVVEGAASAVLLQDGLWVLRPDGWLEGPEATTPALAGQVLVGGAGQVATAAFKAEEDHGRWWVGTDAGGQEHRLERDPGPDSDTNARGVPNLLGAGALRPDGQVWVWGGLKANTERGLYVEGTPLEHDNVVRSVLKVVDAATGQEREQPLFDNRDRVGAVAFTPLGDKLLVAHLGSRIVDVLDGTSMQRVGGFQEVGHGLDGLWTDGQVAWVLASLDRQLVAFDLQSGNAQVELARIDLVEEEVLTAQELLGARIFHTAADPRMSVDSYISCGSCHPEGGEDGRVWDFTQRGEGLRNTLPIWGMPLSGPWHWSANFDELQDFENDIRLHQSGEGFLAEADWAECQEPLGEEKAGRSEELDALAAYMQHLAAEAAPAAPQAKASDAAFLAAGCTGCHSGDRGTDAAWLAEDSPRLWDVGTLTEASGSRLGGELTGLRTPGLVGVAWTGPWLHDGSAASLEEAVLAHDEVVVDEDTLAEIVAYLRSW
ncbi:PKD domain-containing protein [Myxococcota bacterium]|nr:PKD domain-containing protein [Myxococcota bacterium]